MCAVYYEHRGTLLGQWVLLGQWAYIVLGQLVRWHLKILKAQASKCT